MLYLIFLFLFIHKIKCFQPNHYLILPGFGASSSDYYHMKNNMLNLGFKTNILYVERKDWLNQPTQQLKISHKMIQQKCVPQDLYGWYLNELSHEILRIKHENDQEKIILIGHSAGGWLARDFMGDGLFYVDHKPYKIKDYIEHLITLGTPHQKPKNINNDLAFGCLDYVNKKYPNNYLEDVKYTSVGGKINLVDKIKQMTPFTPSFLNYYNDKNCSIGDGLVPHSCVHLNNAVQIDLDDVHHAFDSPYFKWYGHKDIIPKWLNS